jgi:N4-gp56 family major capsid protein
MTTSDNLRKQVWEEQLFRDTLKDSYFMGKFAGYSTQNLLKGMGPLESSPNDVIHVKTNLEAKGATGVRPGDKITFGLVPRIDPATYPGVVSGQKLKGKEVPLSWYDFSIVLERYRQAISAGGPMDWQRASFSIPNESKTALQNWGVEKIDKLCVDGYDASPTVTFYKTSSGVAKTATYATAKSAITVAADSKLTPDMVSFIKTWAKTGGARASNQIPLRPVKTTGGSLYYVLLVYPDVVYDWRKDSTVYEMTKLAKERDGADPVMQGASYVWDNVIIHESEFITVGTDAGGGAIPYAHCHLMGAQSLVWAWGERPSLVEDTEDYQEDHFYAWRMTAKAAKPKFNSLDYGSVSVMVSRTNVSGA